jgi:DNA gyrase/topoisomerase IV subunit A
MMKVYELPVGTKEARGKSLKAIINLGNEESITSICTFKEFSEDAILMATKNGVIKKSPLSVFSNTKKNGIIAIGLDEKDQLIYVNLLKPEQDVILASKRGLAVRTNLAKLRTQGRTAGGVRGMRLSEGDFVTGVTIVEKDSDLESVRKSRVYNGKYFVLGGLVPIVEKNTKSRVRIEELKQRLSSPKSGFGEIILAFSLNSQGDHTDQYVREQIKDICDKQNIKISSLGRGLSTGTELEYSDNDTLKNALKNRQ